MTPLSPFSLALAHEVDRRLSLDPTANPKKVLRAILDEEPDMDLESTATLAAQINQMVNLTTPPRDRARLILLLALPGDAGAQFSRRDVPIVDAALEMESPIAAWTADLARDLSLAWPQIRPELTRLATRNAPALLDQNGRPA